MRNSILWISAFAAALIAGCGEIAPLAAPAAHSGDANFSVYAAMGTSITAGWQSGGLVDYHQRHSYAAVFAHQAGSATFTEPTVSPDGLPPLLRILSLSPLIISNVGRTNGTPTNALQPTPYHNMGVPGALLVDAADSTYYYGGLPRSSLMFDLIVRHRGTILGQVASLSPTFVSLEYGSNEVLGAAANGSGAAALDPATFAALLHGTLDAVHALIPGTKLALVTVPNMPDIPYFTTFSPYTVSLSTGAPVPLIGPGGAPLAPNDYVLLRAGPDLASGKGIPVGAYNYVNPGTAGTGQPLDDAEVLSATEAASITAAVNGYNAAIHSEASARHAALVDLHGLLQTAATVGLRFQGTVYTTRYITGGLFSLDGVHPNDLAHGFLANMMIDAVNSTFGSTIPHADLSRAASITASRLRPDRNESPRYPIVEGGEAYYRVMFAPVAGWNTSLSAARR